MHTAKSRPVTSPAERLKQMYCEKRYFIQTVYDKETGESIVYVMEHKRPYSKPEKIAQFTHEWRACKHIDKLIKAAYERGEAVVTSPELKGSWKYEK